MARLPIDQEEENEPATWGEMRERVIQNSIQLPDRSSPEAKRAEMQSQSMVLLGAFIDEGIRVAKERGLGPMTPGAWQLIDLLSSLATDISLAVTSFPFGMDERAKLTVAEVRRMFRITHPTPAKELVTEAKRGLDTTIDQAGFQDAVGRYLASDFRLPCRPNSPDSIL